MRHSSQVSSFHQTAHEFVKLPTLFYTCHCTGLPAYAMMKEIMGERLQYLACGETVIC